MNREMLLESNNIHFEPTLKNISQMAARLFSSSEEPFVDDFPQNDSEINNMNKSISNSTHDDDDSWRDVKKIFETFNKQMVPRQTSSLNQQPKIINKITDEQSLSKDQNNKFYCHKNPGISRAAKNSDNVEILQAVDCGGTNSNKENIHDSTDQSPSGGLASKYQLPNSNCSKQEGRNNIEHIKTHSMNTSSFGQVAPITTVPTTIDNSKQTLPLYDQANRVRQVNVEMFTVTLKQANQK